MRFVFLFMIGFSACSSVDPIPVRLSKTQVEACTPHAIKCDTACGIVPDGCGSYVTCETCDAPYVCGAQDLQEFAPTPNRCGLGCSVVGSVPNGQCPKQFPINYVCPYSVEMASLISRGWTYACALYPPTKEMDPQKELRFCCGL